LVTNANKKKLTNESKCPDFSLLTLFSCSNADKNNSTGQQQATEPSTISEALVILNQELFITRLCGI
jgi:hypothetical protein